LEDRYVLAVMAFERHGILMTCRYALIDHFFASALSPAHVMEMRNRRKLEAFVGKRVYMHEQGDYEDSA
jgi:hypothetical protein